MTVEPNAKIMYNIIIFIYFTIITITLAYTYNASCNNYKAQFTLIYY